MRVEASAAIDEINDEYGHTAGDEYIREASKTICTTFKHSPVFRYGGDEFVAILRGTDYENRRQILEAFNRAEEEKLANAHSAIAAGMAEYDKGRHYKLLRVLEIADKEMYDRKKYLKEMENAAVKDQH